MAVFACSFDGGNGDKDNEPNLPDFDIIYQEAVELGFEGTPVTRIGDWAFYNCTSLTSIIIPSSVQSIYQRAFYYCTSLIIYCEAESQPSEWSAQWNYSNCPVRWGYKEESN